MGLTNTSKIRFSTWYLLIFLLIASGELSSLVVPWPPCPSSSTCSNGFNDCSSLEDMYQLIKCQMPISGSDVYVEPSDELMADWQRTVASMMYGGSCNLDNLPPSMVSLNYQLGSLVVHLNNNERSYCILATFANNTEQDETIEAPYQQYGTVIVNQSPTSADVIIKDISIDIPHPIFDSRTGEQGLAIFQGTNARSLIISGSPRKTNAAPSCQDGYSFHIADAAHNAQHTFQASVLAIHKFYDFYERDYTAIQFHGMGSSTCPGDAIFATNGFVSALQVLPGPNEKVQRLRTAFLSAKTNSLDAQIDGAFSLPGESSCRMAGSSNTAARLLNGVPNEDVCDTKATSYSQKFLHIEQKAAMRDPYFYQTWIDAINTANISESTTVPTSMPSSSPIASPEDGGMQYCFSGNTVVGIAGRGATLMSDVRIGDAVEVFDEKFEVVYAFGHRNVQRAVEYLRFAPSKLELTRNHMVFLLNKGAVPASMVDIGDRLSDGSVVQGIRTVTRKGAYAPFTPSGTIVANGVLASTYISFQCSNVLILGTSTRTWLTYQWLAHSFQTPHRIWRYWLGMATPDLMIFREDDEIRANAWVIDASLKATVWFLSLQNPFIVGGLLVPLVLILSILRAAESGFAHPILFAAMIVLVVLLWRNRYRRYAFVRKHEKLS